MIKHKQDADRSVNENPILDMKVYDVKFLGGEAMELIANIITELIYVQYDADGYILLL